MRQTELRNHGVLRSSSTVRKAFRKKVKKGRTATQNSSGIHRVLVLMPPYTRIRALREKGNPAA
jgi:hypothetical protein